MGLARKTYSAIRVWLRETRWKAGVLWPVLIDVGVNWEQYLNRLSTPALKNFKASRKANIDLTYLKQPFNRDEIAKFMAVWEKSGNVFPANYISRLEHLHTQGWLNCFGAKLNGELVAVHLVERFNDYGRCHAPWFQTEFGKGRSLSTFMWFSLIARATEPASGFRWLDFGGGPTKKLKRDHYKRRYAPQDTGQIVLICHNCGFMSLV